MSPKKTESGWKIQICHDIVKGQWSSVYKKTPNWVFLYVLASKNGVHYIHRHHFTEDDWEVANHLTDRILAATTFNPEGKPDLWIRVYDIKPLRMPQRDIIQILKQKIK